MFLQWVNSSVVLKWIEATIGVLAVAPKHAFRKKPKGKNRPSASAVVVHRELQGRTLRFG